MDGEFDSQKILEMKAASQMEMQQYLLGEIWLVANDLLKSFLRKQVNLKTEKASKAIAFFLPFSFEE